MYCSKTSCANFLNNNSEFCLRCQFKNYVDNKVKNELDIDFPTVREFVLQECVLVEHKNDFVYFDMHVLRAYVAKQVYLYQIANFQKWNNLHIRFCKFGFALAN